MGRVKSIINDKKGLSPILETLAAVGITVSLLIIFYIAANNVFTEQDKPSIDLEAKSVDILDSLLNSPGSGDAYESNWEGDPTNITSLGLGTDSTIAYGIYSITNDSNTDNITILSQNMVSDSRVGLTGTCFLAGTKIVMADGSYKNIEDVKVGDMVKSFDEKSGKIVDEKVNSVFHHIASEMGDYYLVINKELRVTPNHRFYSDGKWVYAGDLKVGDYLFCHSPNCIVTSIDKVFNREPTYNFEVAGNHNYFVVLDKNDVLVHNAPNGGTPPVPGVPGVPGIPGVPQAYGWPYADFAWFDGDGPYNPGTNIIFDASTSYDSNGYITYYRWWWDWNLSNPINLSADAIAPDKNISTFFTNYDYGDNNVHYVRLNVSDDDNLYNNYLAAVQANSNTVPDIEWRPWVLTGKTIYPITGNNTLDSYDNSYYVIYTNVTPPVNPYGSPGQGMEYYLYEVKEKTNLYSILDYNKILNLSKTDYNIIHSILGFNETNYTYYYSFNITISSDLGGVICQYGPSYEYANVLLPTDKEVLIYHGPQVYNPSDPSNGDVIPPYYENGLITVRVFI